MKTPPLNALHAPAANDLSKIPSGRGFMYRYNSASDRNVLGGLGTPLWIRATYGDQNADTFKSKERSDIEVSDVFVSYISSFLQFADPSIVGTQKPSDRYAWQPYSDNRGVMQINKRRASAVSEMDKERFRSFWNMVAEMEEMENNDVDPVTDSPVDPVTDSVTDPVTTTAAGLVSKCSLLMTSVLVLCLNF